MSKTVSCCLVTRSCLTLGDPMDCGPQSSSGILQARTLEWVAISFSRGSSWLILSGLFITHISGFQTQLIKINWLLKWECPKISGDILWQSKGLETIVHTGSVTSNSLRPCGLEPARLLYLWDFLGKNTGVGCHFLFQGSSWPRDRTSSSVSPALAGRFFITAPPEKQSKRVSKWIWLNHYGI